MFQNVKKQTEMHGYNVSEIVLRLRSIYRRTIIEKTIVIEIKIYFKIRSRDSQFEIRLNNARYPSDKILKFDSSTKID